MQLENAVLTISAWYHYRLDVVKIWHSCRGSFLSGEGLMNSVWYAVGSLFNMHAQCV